VDSAALDSSFADLARIHIESIRKEIELHIRTNDRKKNQQPPWQQGDALRRTPRHSSVRLHSPCLPGTRRRARFPYFPKSWCQEYPADRVTASQNLKRLSHLYQGIGMTGKKAQPTIGNQSEQLRYACADLFRP
jgi:hypothetical protein